MRLDEASTLWCLFVATLLLTATFPIAAAHWGIEFIDAVSDPDRVRDMIAAMTSTQRSAHAWLTATLDVAYPLAYGSLFAGSALVFFPRYGRFLAIAGFAVIPVDLVEGVVQVLALVGAVDWLDLKAVLTPAKFALFLLGLLITVLGWVSWVVARFRTSARDV